jgi:hypothetical protein
MYKDSIVEEVRSIREDYAREFGYDLHAICEDLRKYSHESGRPVVRLQPKRVRHQRKPSDEPLAV